MWKNNICFRLDIEYCFRFRNSRRTPRKFIVGREGRGLLMQERGQRENFVNVLPCEFEPCEYISCIKIFFNKSRPHTRVKTLSFI